MKFSEITHTIDMCRELVEVFRSRIQEHDTGHLYTTIDTLENYIEELEKQVIVLESQLELPLEN
tara:strand:- start:115 stop:306 length:192 start_codon:yes stop_codon:yes gene_type:complete